MDTSKKKPLIPLPVVLGIVLLLVMGLAIGATFYYFVEGMSPVDSIYFAAMTLTTVGYGDFAPKTDLGKMFTAVYAFVGIGTFLGFAAIISQTALDRMHRLHKSFTENHKPKP